MPFFRPNYAKKNEKLKAEIRAEFKKILEYERITEIIRKNINDAIKSLEHMHVYDEKENKTLNDILARAQQVTQNLAINNTTVANTTAKQIKDVISSSIPKIPTGKLTPEQELEIKLAEYEDRLKEVKKKMFEATRELERNPDNQSAWLTAENCDIECEAIKQGVDVLMKSAKGLKIQQLADEAMNMWNDVKNLFDEEVFDETLNSWATMREEAKRLGKIVDDGADIFKNGNTGNKKTLSTTTIAEVQNKFRGIKNNNAPQQVAPQQTVPQQQAAQNNSDLWNLFGVSKADLGIDDGRPKGALADHIGDINKFINDVGKVRDQYNEKLKELNQMKQAIMGRLREKLEERKAKPFADELLDRDIDELGTNLDLVARMIKLYMSEDATLRNQRTLAIQAQNAYTMGKERENLGLNNSFVQNFKEVASLVDDFAVKLNEEFNDWRGAVNVASGTEIETINGYDAETLSTVKNEDKYASLEKLVGMR